MSFQDLLETHGRKRTRHASNQVNSGARNTSTEQNLDANTPTSGMQITGMSRALQHHGNSPPSTPRAILQPGFCGASEPGETLPSALSASICYEGLDSPLRESKPNPPLGLFDSFSRQAGQTPESPPFPSTSKALVSQTTRQPSFTGLWSGVSDFPHTHDATNLPALSNARGDDLLATGTPFDFPTCGLGPQYAGNSAFQLAIPQDIGLTSHTRVRLQSLGISTTFSN